MTWVSSAARQLRRRLKVMVGCSETPQEAPSSPASSLTGPSSASCPSCPLMSQNPAEGEGGCRGEGGPRSGSEPLCWDPLMS